LAHSHVAYADLYILLRDEQIAWLMENIVQEAAVYEMPPGLNDLLEWWEDKRHTFGPGCIELRLDDFLRDTESPPLLIDILARIA
jgi:hypothetical protein